MTKKSPEMFRQYLDVLGRVIVMNKATRIVGIGEDTPRSWETQSRRDEALKVAGSIYYFEHAGVTDWFHRHTRRAISRSIEDIEAAARDRALNGVWQPAMYKGQTVYKRDPELIGRPDLVELLGLPDDLLRDPVTGLPQPELVWTPPATDLVLGVLAANSNRYKRQSRIELDARVSGGVVHAVAQSPKMVDTAPAPAPAIAAPVPQIEDAEFSEEPSDVTDTAPLEYDPPDVISEPVPEPEPERVIRSETPQDWQPSAPRSLTKLELDLLNRLKNPATRSANPIGSTKSVMPLARPNDE